MSHGRFDNPVIASLAGFWDRFRKQEKEARFTDKDRFDGKICLITGTTTGLGFALSVHMASRGARVLMANRTINSSTLEKVKHQSGSDQVEQRYLDLSKLQSIHDFIDQLLADGIHPDVIILNAGVALPMPRKTESGLEEMFMVNYMSNVILTLEMIAKGLISAHAGSSPLPRIIFISSDSHQGSSAIDYSEFGVFYNYGVSKGIQNYSYFKLILNTYAVELSRRINSDRTRVGVNVICPGPVHSNITRAAPLPLRMVLNAIFSIIFRKPMKAALPVVYMAISSDYEGKTAEYLHMFIGKKMDPKCYIPEEGKKLWDESLKLWRSIDPLSEKIIEAAEAKMGKL
jgi:NAD(P)-dependent dehydrogenase (short-subunit alcohol dehydrogenase family)